MNTYQKKILIAMTVIGLGSTTLVAHAEKEDGQMRGPMASEWHHGEGKGKFAEQMKARMEKHQAEVHDKLKLTAAQEPAWKTFIAAMHPTDSAKNADQHAATQNAMQNLTAPERMEKMIERMKVAETRMGTRLAALKTFYATLTPAQKKIFDDNMGRHHHHHDNPKK